MYIYTHVSFFYHKKSTSYSSSPIITTWRISNPTKRCVLQARDSSGGGATSPPPQKLLLLSLQHLLEDSPRTHNLPRRRIRHLLRRVAATRLQVARHRRHAHAVQLHLQRQHAPLQPRPQLHGGKPQQEAGLLLRERGERGVVQRRQVRVDGVVDVA